MNVSGLRQGGTRALVRVRGGTRARVQGEVVNMSGPRRDEESYKLLAVNKKARKPWAMYEEAHVPKFEVRW